MRNDSEVAPFISELEEVVKNFHQYHGEMQQYKNFYKYSSFFPVMPGEIPIDQRPKRNLLKAFAQKNILYTSGFPKINVPAGGSDPTTRQYAAARERICYAAWDYSGGALLQAKWAFDTTIYSAAIAETVVDLKTRRVYVKRHSPKRCYWQLGNVGGKMEVIAFWAVSAISSKACKKKYGRVPTSDPIATSVNEDDTFQTIDGQEWFTEVYRWDAKTRTHFVGNEMIEPQHNTLLGCIPIDICMPFNDDDEDGNKGAFYLEDLIIPQAELNDVIYRRRRVVRRSSDPTTWARGIGDEAILKYQESQHQGSGGFLAVGKDGEVGILQLQDTKMLNETKQDIINDMQMLAGFGPAAWGTSEGANTSGDAINMRFAPTQKHVDGQNIHWVSFYKSVNAKILKGYDVMLTPEERIKLDGHIPYGAMIPVETEEGDYKDVYHKGGFSIEFGREVISGQYASVPKMPDITPKNEIEYKRLVFEAVNNKFISRTTGFEKWEIDDPEQELEMLKAEQSEPLLAPDVAEKILSRAQAPNGNTPAPAASK